MTTSTARKSSTSTAHLNSMERIELTSLLDERQQATNIRDEAISDIQSAEANIKATLIRFNQVQLLTVNFSAIKRLINT